MNLTENNENELREDEDWINSKKQRRWQYAAVVYFIVVIALVSGLMIYNNKPHSTPKQEKNHLAEEVQIYEPNEEGYYILCSEDLLQSVELEMPDGFRLYEFSDEYWFVCTDMDKENGVANIYAWIDKKDAESEKTSMIQEVETTFALNYFSSTEIGEIQQKQIGDYEISFFSYNCVTAQNRVDEGYRAWTPLGEDYCLCFMIEKAKADVKKIDIESYLETLIRGNEDENL